MRVLVTGGLGGLGRHVSLAISEAGHELRILAHRSKKYANWFPKNVISYGDITKPESYQDVLGDLDAVVHLSFLLPPTSETHPRAEEVNVGGTETLVRLLEELNPTCRLIFPSSVTTYGITIEEEPPIETSHSQDPTSNYTAHKITCERLIESSKLTNWVILRVAAGIYLEVAPTLRNLHRLYDIPLDQRVEFVHIKDAATACFHALTADCARGTFNVGGGPTCQMSFREEVTRILKVYHLSLPPEKKFCTEPYPLDWYDTTRSQAVLDYQHHTFADYLSDLKEVLGWRQKLYWLVSPLANLYIKHIVHGYRPIEGQSRVIRSDL